MESLDVIELRRVVDGWDAGTVATVLEVGEDTVLAEVADQDGRTLEVIVVPLDAAEITWEARRPETSRDVPRRPNGGPSQKNTRASIGRPASATSRPGRPSRG